MEDSYHQYEEPAGIFVCLLRVASGIVCLVGCQTLMTQSVGKRRAFMSNYVKLGAAYLFAWPCAVIICEFLLPKYLHN